MVQNEVHRGRIIKLGDDIDTDIIIPTQYLTLKTIDDMLPYAFSPLRQEISSVIKKGDILLCGKNFGCGSSREQASEIIKALGVYCVIAKSFARIFYRNAINNGLLMIQNSDIYEKLEEGDEIIIDIENHWFKNEHGERIAFSKIPKMLINMIKVGGLVQYWKEQNKRKK